MKQDAVCRRSAHEVASASAAVSRHVASARAYEQKLLASLIGRPASRTAFERMQSDLDAIAIEQQRLCAREEAAESVLRDHRLAAEAARKDFRERQRAAAKLALIAKEAKVRAARYEAALAEHADEDWSANSAFPSADGQHGK
jgi:hypothetical protein